MNVHDESAAAQIVQLYDGNDPSAWLPQERPMSRMCALIEEMERFYRNEQAPEDAKHLSYWRGKFWQGDGYLTQSSSRRDEYVAQQNEMFPVLDTISSALALDLPQVECMDQRVLSYAYQSRQQDAAIAGRRVAAPLNWYAANDDMDTTTHELVMNALLFKKGGIVKTSWDIRRSCLTWRSKLPWEIFIDPNCRRIGDAGWIFERFVLHMDEMADMIERGIYVKPKRSIRPDGFPRSLIADAMGNDEDRRLQELGLKEYVHLTEFWDFYRGVMYHVHLPTKQVLLATPIEYGNPYTSLVYHPAVGRAEGVSDAGLVAPVQRDINEMVSARREMVARLPRRMVVDGTLFKDDTEWDAFITSRTYRPVKVSGRPDRPIAEHFYVTPEMPTTFDFNKHLDDQTEHLRYALGIGVYQRGQVSNIRTAEEAQMIRASVEGRLGARVQATVKCVTGMFQTGLRVLQWAMRNAEEVGLDILKLHARTQVDVDPWSWFQEIQTADVKFRVLPFSPLMEDRNTRRAALERLIATIASSPMAAEVDWPEITREFQESYSLRPSILKSAQRKAQEQAEAAAAAAAGAPPATTGVGQPIPIPDAGRVGPAGLGEQPL